jgi:hypothetical protein
MPQAQALFQQMGGQTVTKGMDADLFFIPQSVTIALTACCTPPRSIGWVA